MSPEVVRSAGAGATLLGYIALCGAIWWRERRRAVRSAAAAQALSEGSVAPTLVLYASQTGQAEALAWDTARRLHADGTPVRVLALNALDAATLAAAPRALFIVSTYGEGDPPDGASLFVETVMAAPLPLTGLRYGVLALGDRQYQNFCGFGRALDEWMHRSGAIPDFARIDVDNGEASSLRRWDASLGLEATQEAAPVPFAGWRLGARELLNAGSAGAPIYRIVLEPPAGVPADWHSGDLVQIQPPGDPGRPRDYSIASIARDGVIELLVRQERHPDGQLGIASGWLTGTLALGGHVPARLRAHPSFRLGANAHAPLILIGNGTGLAGLRGHLRARAAAGLGDNWLVFGERQAQFDTLCRDEIAAWQAAGLLRRVDRVFSRDATPTRYVQHRLLEDAAEVRAWIDRGAAIYICGSLAGMAGGVDSALRQIAGAERFAALVVAGRYRRDVY